MAENQNSTAVIEELPKFKPGVLCATPFSRDGEIKFSDEEIAELRSLFEKCQQRDEPARREQIIDIWQARLFDRGKQHILPRRGGGWSLPAPGSGYTSREIAARSMFIANVYNCLMQTIVAVLTRDVPYPKFEASNPDDDADYTAAEAADDLTGYILKANNAKGLMADIGRFFWTDAMAVLHTDYYLDGQRYGYGPDPEAVVPEDEQKVSEEDESEADETDGEDEGTEEEKVEAGDEAENQKKPRGREQIDITGGLEWKFPIKAKSLSQCGYCIKSQEFDEVDAKAMFPEVAEKITPGEGGPGGDDISRLARVNVLLGVEDNFVTTDSQAYDVTIQIGYFRPSQLLAIGKPDIRNSLLQKAGTRGLEITFAGETFCRGRSESMDDHVALLFCVPGDGVHRVAMGANFLPLQKVLNNLLEMANDYLVRGIPLTWMDNEMFNVEGISKQTRIPGGILPFDRQPGVTMEQVIWQELVLQFPAELRPFIDLFRGEFAQLMTGAYPAMFGGDSGSEGVGDHLAQRDQALGRLGLAWNSIKEGLAISVRQAVACLARNHDGSVKTGGEDSITVEMTDLKGEILCSPSSDENFPLSWAEQQQRVDMLIEQAPNNPYLAQFLDDPQNLEFVKDSIGLKKFSIPALESVYKQLGEIKLMQKSGPIPNPVIAELTAQLEKATAAAKAGDQEAIAALPEMEQKINQVKATEPPEVSSQDVDEVVDDSDIEAAVCLKFLRSRHGRRMKNGTEEEQASYENIKLHYQAHAKIAAANKKAAAAQASAAQQKPVAVSLNAKDAPPKEAAAIYLKAGVADATPGDFAADAAAEAIAKHPGKGGIVQ